MSQKKIILKGTAVLTVTGFLSRVMGFFYRIFLSHTFGESGVGLYQLIFPVYGLVFSFTSAGIELALSRCVSKYLALGNKKRARELLYTSLIFSLTLSIVCTLFLQNYSSQIAERYLYNPDTRELLIILSYIFPLSSVHSCIVGYYLGMKQTKTASISQILEQGIRILSVFILYRLSTVLSYDFTISFAVAGLIFGEAAAAIYCVRTANNNSRPLRLPRISIPDFLSCSIELAKLSCPLTGSRVLLNILQSIEAVSIPLSLKLYGYDSTDALSIYGVLTGMALPCILFPSAITNAVSTMLLPAVSEIQALENHDSLYNLFRKTLLSCTLLGFFCCICFLCFGNIAGNIIFNSSLAGKFIITLAWMCPFLYTNNTLISIINGIGKPFVSFLINTCSLSIRIISVLKIIPLYGIHGYLIGLLCSQFFTFLFSLIFLCKHFKAKVS